MKNILLLFLFLIPAFLFAQYPAGTNKSRLGYQTTGDGLIWRGVAADTAIKPRTTANAYFQLDTVNRVLRRYIATQGSWQVVAVTPNLTPYALKTYVDSLYATDHDRDSTNELQTLTFASPLLGISDGNNVDLSPILSGYVTGSGTANYLPKWSAITNLTNSNLFDNNIYVGILNSKPFALGQWATAGRPTGVTGYTGYNTTLGVTEQYNGSTYDQFAMLSKTQTFTGVNNFNNDIYYNNTLKQTTTTAYSLNYLNYAAQSTNHGVFLSFGANGIPTDNMYGMSFGGKATGTDIPAFLLVGSNSHKNNVLALVNYGSSPQNYDFTLQNKTGDWNGSGDYHLVIKQGGAINIGHKDSPTFDVNLKKSKANAHLAYFAQNTSSTGNTSYQLQNNLGYSGGIGKWGSASTAYKTIAANNTYLYNSTEAGNLVLLNDYASGNINFATGGGSTAQMTLASTGNLLLGTTTDVSRRLHVSGEARITDLTTDPPTRIVGADADGDLGAMAVSGGLSISSGTLSSTWLKPQLEAGSVTINAATNADLFINNLDSVKFGKTLIRSSNNGLLILNPDVGASGISAFGGGYHTVINGTLSGSDGGTGNIAIGGTITANTTGSIFGMSIGYASNILSAAYGLGVGYNADVTADNAAAFGRNALADEVGEMSLGSSIYSKINLWTNSGDIYAKGDIIAEDSVKVTTRPSMPSATDIAVYDGSGWLGYRTLSSLADGNGIYTGSGTLSSHTTRAAIPSTGNLLFTQKYNSNADSAYIQVINDLDGNREVRLGLTDTMSTGSATLALRQDADNEVMAWDLRSSDGSGATRLTGDGGNISATVDEGFEVQISGMVRAKREAYAEITSTSSPQTFSNTYSDNFVNQGGTQASFTFLFPASPEDGQILSITWGNAISVVTLDGNGNTIEGTAVTTATAGTRRQFKYYASAAKWFKIY
jgi:hypothetical protein